MSDMKHVILLNVPEILRMQSDGTVAKEVKEAGRVSCPRCNGSGQVLQESPHDGQLYKEQCDVCLGYRTLKARICIEWIPDK